jgi:GNAT superfamily N-acetyltransferase
MPIITPSSPTEKDWLTDQLMCFNREHLAIGESDYLLPLNFHIKHHDDTIITGINAVLFAKSSAFVSILWVDHNHRGHDYGSLLLRHVESEAKTLGAAMIHLETFDFQAKGFYLKNEYTEFAALENSPAVGRKRYYMTKSL